MDISWEPTDTADVEESQKYIYWLMLSKVRYRAEKKMIYWLPVQNL